MSEVRKEGRKERVKERKEEFYYSTVVTAKKERCLLRKRDSTRQISRSDGRIERG